MSDSDRPTEARTDTRRTSVTALGDALAAADIKRLVRASREDDGNEVERIRRRYTGE
ncbi:MULTISPECIES: hypothetical protein [Nocardiopsis]|uniref:FXSXX-COOH protein n=1 Tax=Nocardiopsis lambiniae TaxID=3075539 RepID=A0ABU2MBT9_9ACTN|nr:MULTISPECIES: hypothetical protein [unclassified Nocardiopsis]MDE3723564.1 hypothetical protein [Nocardiopsis sp. N85]MDT0330040.1 hypothetical protein [Nocardiopsis sp. DSM 44743]